MATHVVDPIIPIDIRVTEQNFERRHLRVRNTWFLFQGKPDA
jgi:hypothetical protein